MPHINVTSNNVLTYEDIKMASRMIQYDNYKEIYDTVNHLTGISRVFKTQQCLENPKFSNSSKRTLKQVLKDLEDV